MSYRAVQLSIPLSIVDPMNLTERIGFDAGANRLEDALEFAVANGFHFVDFNADTGANHMDTWDAERVADIRSICDRNAISLGLHTLSAVNVAEYSPHVARGVENYMRSCVDLANRLGCEWTVVHAGYHFSSDPEARLEAAISRLQRIARYAADTGQRILLENLNREPENAEVRYLAHNVDECRRIFDAIAPESLGWSFTVNHAHLVPEGIDGFLYEFGIERIGEVRLADNTGDYEVHLVPGEGTIDWRNCMNRLESAGYSGHYAMAYGNDAQKIESRAWLASLVEQPA